MADTNATELSPEKLARLREAVIKLPFIAKCDPEDAYGTSTVLYIPRDEVLALLTRAALASEAAQ